MMETTPRRGLMLAGASALLVIGASQPGHAQDAAATADAEVALEEVVVTARRTEEKLLDVPLAISAFSAADIEERGIRNLDDVAANTPGLTFSNLIGEFLPVPVIRGVAPVSIFNENNAAVFVDGAYVSGREGLNFSQLDIERIEVIKGPQAAAYGRNAFSGAINYVTAKPTDELRAKVEATVGNESRLMGLASVSGPLIGDTLFGRAAILKDEWDGSYQNQFAGGPNIGGYDFTTFQGSLRWVPTDSFEALLSVYVSDDQIDVSPLSAVAANCEDRRVADPMQSSRLLNFCGELPTINSDSLSVIPAAIGEDRDLFRSNLTLTWDVLGGTITSITGYSSLQQSFFEDGTRGRGEGETFAYVSRPVIPGVNAGVVRTFDTGLLQIGPGDETDEISEELRYTSAKDRAFRFSVGAYYYSTESEGAGDGVVATRPRPADFFAFCPCVPIGGGRQFAIPGFGDGALGPWWNNPVTGDTIFTPIVGSEVDAWSLFGYAEYDFAENWTARVEGRWSNEEKTSIDFRANRSVSDEWTFPTWRVTVDWKPTPDWTLYAAVAEAAKAGGFDSANVAFTTNAGQTQLVQTTYDEETNLSFEIGAKAALWDGRVRLDADVYWIDWTDIVLPQVLSEVNGMAIVTPTAFDVNAGDATIKGVEFTLEARLSRAWKANLGAAWSDAEFDVARLDSFIQFPTYAPTGDISGNKIQRQSEWQANAGLSFDTPVSDNVDFYARADLAYRGKQFADNSNQTIVPSNTQLNANFGFRRGNFTVEFWGRNLTHEDAPTGAFRDVYFSNFIPTTTLGSAGAFFPFRYTVSHPRLTTYGVTGRYKF